MIVGKDDLFERINNHSFEKQSNLSYTEKLKLFEKSIDNSIKNILKEILKDKEEIHLAYSGGIDSSLLLVKILKNVKDIPVIAHTVGSNYYSADFYYSKFFADKLKKNYPNLQHEIHHTLIVNEEDVKIYKEIFKTEDYSVDGYYFVPKTISQYTNKLISGECIDELLGGYGPERISKDDEDYKKVMSQLPIYIEIDGDKDEIELKDILKSRMSRFERIFIKASTPSTKQEKPVYYSKYEEREALKYRMSDFMPVLLRLNAVSSHFKMNVFLPFGAEEVMNFASYFKLREMIYKGVRKKPIYDIARRNKIHKKILYRKKIGLGPGFLIETYFKD